MAQTQDTGTLYLRGIPRKLVREAKAEAARRGMSLTAFAREALARALGMGTTAADTSAAREPEGIEAIRPDLDWFEANRKRLLRRYHGDYVAIINRKVLDHPPPPAAPPQRGVAQHGTARTRPPPAPPRAAPLRPCLPGRAASGCPAGRGFRYPGAAPSDAHLC